MNDSRPADARREETPGGRHSERSASVGHDDEERDLRWRIRGRLHACLVELKPMVGVDWDSILTILEGAAEEIQAAS
jgi:hypothetical protein